MGKGSAPRPLPDYDQYSFNWDNIFRKDDMKARVSGVPYEVELPEQTEDDIIATLEQENRMMRARMERLEAELAVLTKSKDDLK
jgi:hypothetical protein